LDKLSALVLVLDRKGQIVLANQNPLARDLFSGSVTRRCRYDSSASALPRPMVEMIRSSYSEPYAPVHGQFEIGNGDHTRRVDLVIYPRVDKRNQLLGKIVIAEDITGQTGKVIVAQATQQWIHRLKGNMATARLVIGNLLEDERMAKALARDTLLKGYIDSINRQLGESAETIRKVLRFTRIGKPERVESDINKVVDLALEPYVRNPPHNVAVAKVLQGGLPTVRLDPGQMAEVIDNLLSNALHAYKQGGCVTVSTRLADDLLGIGRGRAVEIVVEDTGSGIAFEDLERIFLPGFTRCAGGTGIGLALVKEIVENHGGRILVESTPGQGSRFTIRIPVEG
jgi:signal transduction histidine kinase